MAINKLESMMEHQAKLQERLGYDLANMSTGERTDYVKEFSIHANQEMNEMLYELPHFKPWKDYSNKSIEEQEQMMQLAREEYIDFFHFVLNIGLGLNMTAEDIYNMYLEKNKINHERQDNGYHG